MTIANLCLQMKHIAREWKDDQIKRHMHHENNTIKIRNDEGNKANPDTCMGNRRTSISAPRREATFNCW